MNQKIARVSITLAVMLAITAAYMVGRHDSGDTLELVADAQAEAPERDRSAGWSPTQPYPEHRCTFPAPKR